MTHLPTGIDIEHARGNTREGQRGWIAWIDSDSRQCHVKQAKCIQVQGRMCVVRTDDNEHTLTVPLGRLDWSASAALEQLAYDVRREGEGHMNAIQQEQARLETRRGAIATAMLIDLVAIEMAKAGSGDEAALKTIGQSLQRLTHEPVAVVE